MNYNDPRNQAADHDDPRKFNESTMTLSILSEDEDGEECVITLPAKFVVCGLCDGSGTHVNPAIDEHGLTADDFHDDPDFRESYFSGLYDVPCYKCQGKRVAPEVNTDNLSKDQKADYETYLANLQADAEYESMCRAERAMGA